MEDDVHVVQKSIATAKSRAAALARDDVGTDSTIQPWSQLREPARQTSADRYDESVPPLHMTQALLFDLGDVIVGLDFPRAYRAAAELSRYSAEEIPQVIHRAKLASPYERGELSTDDFYRRFLETLGIDIPFEQFRALWQDMFHAEPLLSEDLLAGLARRHRLVLVSNTNELHFRYIERRYRLLRHFHERVLSYEVGLMKPDAGIYETAIKRARCPAPACLFVDDKQANVEGARQAGLDAVRFEGQGRLEEELIRRGVEWKGCDR